MYEGTDWLGEYTRWSFDETKNYIMVAKEMRNPTTGNGVPLMDSELNEQAEINLTLLRRVIHRSFGNGSNNNGFKIVESAFPTNNFVIKGGDGSMDNAGYIFVNGWMPFLTTDLEYISQSGFAALNTPTGARTDYVYIDVYLDEYGPLDDPDIIDPYIGIETSRRIKLVWNVMVAENDTVPLDGLDANNIWHWRMPLAKLARTASATITNAMITDLRNTQRVNPAGTRTYAGSPYGNLVPMFLGEEVFDTSGLDWYKATGLTSAYWKKLT